MAQLLGKGTHNTGSADNIGGGQAIVSRFQCTTSGTVDTLEFLSDAAYTGGSGLTGAYMGIFADSAGAVGALLGQNQVLGVPANPFIVTGLSIPVVAGTFYWIGVVAYPAGASAGVFNFNDNSAGSANQGGVSVSTAMTSLSTATSWTLTNSTAVPWAMFGSGTPSGGGAPAQLFLPRARNPSAGPTFFASLVQPYMLYQAPAITAVATLNVAVAEQVNALDAPTVSIGNFNVAETTDAVLVTDAPTVSLASFNVAVAESVVTTDAPTISIGNYNISVAESVVTLDAPSETLVSNTQVSESVVLGFSEPPTNLCKNPNFEHDTAGSAPAAWSATTANNDLHTGAVLTVVNTTSAQGTQSMQVVTDGLFAVEGAGMILGVGAADGVTQYQYSVWMKGNAGGEAVTLFMDSNIGNHSTAVTLTTTWTQYTMTAWTPSAGVINIAINVYGTSSAAITFFVDQVMSNTGATLAPYFDGDTPGDAWTGTPGNSTSATGLVHIQIDDNVSITTDAVQVTDAPTVVVPVTTLSVAVAESVVVTESVVAFEPFFAVTETTDAVVVTEAVTVALAPPSVAVLESVIVTESVTAFLPFLNVAVLESVNATDVVTPELVSNVAETTDHVSATDVVNVCVASNVADLESVVATESTRETVVSLVADLESVVVADTPTVSLASFNVAVSESVVVTEAVVANNGTPSVAVSESVVLSEWIVLALDPPIIFTLEVAVAESVLTTEAVNVCVASNVADLESVVVTEAVALTAIGSAVNVAVTESVVTTDVVATPSVTVSVNETTDAVHATDAAVLSLTSFVADLESVQATDAPTVAVTTSIADQESVVVTEAASVFISTLAIAVLESVQTTDAPTVLTATASLAVLESVVVTDAPTLLLTALNATAAEAVVLTEATTELLTSLNVAVAESVVATESQTVGIGLASVADTELVVVTEAATAFVPFLMVAVSEGATASEATNETLVSFISETTDAVHATEALAEQVVSFIFDAELVHVTETTSELIPNLNVTASESVVLTEAVSTNTGAPSVSVSTDLVGVLDVPTVQVGLVSGTIYPTDSCTVGDRATVQIIYRWAQGRGGVAPTTPINVTPTVRKPSRQAVVASTGRVALATIPDDPRQSQRGIVTRSDRAPLPSGG